MSCPYLVFIVLIYLVVCIKITLVTKPNKVVELILNLNVPQLFLITMHLPAFSI
jgi:hypothetical protein